MRESLPAWRPSMRLIHTADWHLGQTLHDFDRSHEHARFLDWLLDVLEAERADALLVAGDVFDVANPSSAAQALFYDFLGRARRRLPGLGIVVIAGNHDSPGRMEAPAPVLQGLGIHVVGQVPRDASGTIDAERMVLPLRDARGDVAAWCIAVPFLRAGDVPRIEPDDEDAATGDAFAAGVAALYARAFAHAASLRTPGQAIVAMGHCHMVGGTVSELSERRIVIGGSEALPTSVFAPTLAYTALGHLHLAQRAGAHEGIRYSGSPLPMSFAEVGYTHQVLRVDLDGDRLAAVTPLPVPRAVELLRVPATPAAPDDAIAALAALDLPEAAPEAQPYLLVRVVLEAPEPGLRQRVEQALAGKPVRLARIEISRPGAGVAGDGSQTLQPLGMDELARLDPMAVFAARYRRDYTADPPAGLVAAFAEIADAVARKQDA
jgi:exonuclease SbcD